MIIRPIRRINSLITSQRTGFTLRQLDWMDRTGVVKCARQKGTRMYGSLEIETLQVMRRLRDKGLTAQRVRRLAAQIKKNVQARDVKWVVVDDLGKGISFHREQVNAWSRVLQSNRPMLLVEVIRES